jgi:hypothetical protein
MWSEDTFAHVSRAAAAMEARVQELLALLALGPDHADPQAVHRAGLEVEDSFQAFWAPVVWDQFPEATLS